MKHKTAELEAALLDAAVAIALGGGFDPRRPSVEFQMTVPEEWAPVRDGRYWRADGTYSRLVLAGPQPRPDTRMYQWSPSTDWADGGPIIERERIDIQFTWEGGSDADRQPIPHPLDWHAMTVNGEGEGSGPTPLIAAMRAYVESKCGIEVDLPLTPFRNMA